MPSPRSVALPGVGPFDVRLRALHDEAAGQISEHDEKLGRKIAFVLTAGRPPGTKRTEQELLDLEREAFLSLCGERRPSPDPVHADEGKPLRN